jgi:hypothetical protein
MENMKSEKHNSTTTDEYLKKIDSISNKMTKKKIGFFSSIMLVIGSSVGAGIFIKN